MQDRAARAVSQTGHRQKPLDEFWTAHYSQIILAFVASLTAVVFYFDITTGSPLAAGMLYIPLVLSATQFRHRNAVWIFAAVACCLTLTGFLLPRVHGDTIAMTNRLLSAGSIILAAVFVRDQQRTQDRLAGAIARAETAESAKSHLFQNASHEFRTSLTAVLGFTELLRDGCLPEQTDAIGAIEQGGQRLLDAVENLIDLTALEEQGPCLTRIDMKDTLELALARLNRAAGERDIKFVWDPPFDPAPAALGDDWAVRRILDNLLRNAVKFSPQGGRVRLKVRREDDRIAVEIADNGRGMRPALIEKLGDPLIHILGAAGRDSDGLGIGLALSVKLARLTGGRLKFASDLGRGTTAILSLPIA
jgi:signal transduction histidine kinase